MDVSSRCDCVCRTSHGGSTRGTPGTFRPRSPSSCPRDSTGERIFTKGGVVPNRCSNCLCNLSSLMLEAEVSRLVRLRPEEVCHIPRALDFFLTKEALESDAPELPHVLTWARCSPIRALSLLCQRTLPTHPLTAQGGCLLDYLDGILNSCTNPARISEGG